MKNGSIQLLDIDFEYKLWKTRLAYYLQVVELYLDRSKVVSREHIEWKWGTKQNRLLLLQRDRIKNLQNTIRTHEQEMAFFAEDYPITSEHSHYHEHEALRLEMEKLGEQQEDLTDTVFGELCYPMSIVDTHVNE